MTFGRSGNDKDKSTATPSLSDVTPAVGSVNPGKLEAFLGKGSKVVGNLTFTGPVELDGYVEGEVNAVDKITIGESAVINAKIIGGEVVIKGTVNGDVNASKRLSLKKPAKILGNISSTNLSIEEGVVFEGKCIMGNSSSSENKNVTQPKPTAVPAPPKIGASA